MLTGLLRSLRRKLDPLPEGEEQTTSKRSHHKPADLRGGTIRGHSPAAHKGEVLSSLLDRFWIVGSQAHLEEGFLYRLLDQALQVGTAECDRFVGHGFHPQIFMPTAL